MARFTWPWQRTEKFSQYSIGDPAFAAWLYNTSDFDSELVTPSTVLGISAVLRAVSIISGTIASLPLKTYRRKQNGERTQVPSVFDDPLPGEDGMTPFSWVETIIIHELLWRKAFLWHESRDRNGFVDAFRPILPDAVSVKVTGNRKRFTYRDVETGEQREVGTEWITHIPGPSLDGIDGHPFLSGARAIFSGAISGDKAAQAVLRRGIRLAGLITPAEGTEQLPDEKESEAILDQLRNRIVGREHAGDIAFINRRLKLAPWTPNNVEAQWHETRTMVLGEVGRLFGIPPHLLNDTEKQTSWGTGVAEQNLGLARFTLMGWTSRTEQALSRRLPRGQFAEFDYKGLLQGTPNDEIKLLIWQVTSGIIAPSEARRVLNLPALTAKQRSEIEARMGTEQPDVRLPHLQDEANDA